VQLALAIILTVLIEYPIIKAFKVAANKELIFGVNIVTNALFNGGMVFLSYVFGWDMLLYAIIAEGLVIPVTEGLVYFLTYNKDDRKGSKSYPRLIKTMLASYAANVTSLVVGTLGLKLIWTGILYLVYSFLYLRYVA
jgi:hypothetical protein